MSDSKIWRRFSNRRETIVAASSRSVKDARRKRPRRLRRWLKTKTGRIASGSQSKNMAISGSLIFNKVFVLTTEPLYGIIKIGDTKSEKLKVAIANVSVSVVTNLEDLLKTKKPNRTYLRYRDLSELVNTAIKEKADVLVLPENYVPFEWLSALASKSAREGLAIITGVEHIIQSVRKMVYNYTAVILPFKYFNIIPTAAVFLQLKKFYSPEEKRIIEGYGFKAAKDNLLRPLCCWKDCYFPVYTCFELSAINDRAEFMSWADMVVAVEFNKDTNYFGSIVDSLTRDLHCYCVQVNTSEYGDSRISQPTKREEQNLISVKGGLNQGLLIGEVDIQALREFQLKDYSLQKGGAFKPTPPGIDVRIVRGKLDGNFNYTKD